MKRQRFTDEEKQASLELVIACGNNVAEAARRAKVEYDTLYGWTIGQGVSKAIYQDYQTAMRARVRERVDALHASKDEVLSVAALQMRGDLADIAECIGDAGMDWEKARRLGVSRLVKKFKVTRRERKNVRGETEPEIETEVEIHDPFRPTQLLANVHGLLQKKSENQDNTEAKRKFWRTQIERVMTADKCDESAAREWLVANVPAARDEKQWLM
jgi:transposase-like protein